MFCYKYDQWVKLWQILRLANQNVPHIKSYKFERKIWLIWKLIRNHAIKGRDVKLNIFDQLDVVTLSNIYGSQTLPTPINRGGFDNNNIKKEQDRHIKQEAVLEEIQTLSTSLSHSYNIQGILYGGPPNYSVWSTVNVLN